MSNKIINDIPELDFQDVLIRPKTSGVNSRKDVSISKDFRFKHSGDVLGAIGIMASNMTTTGTFKMSEVLSRRNMFCCLHKHYPMTQVVKHIKTNFKTRETNDNLFISSGIRTGDYDMLKNILYCTEDVDFRNVVLDVPNGYIDAFVARVKLLRKEYPRLNLIAGNVVDAEGCKRLIDAGVDGVKIQIGNGSVCLTRKETGVGRPSLSCIMECRDVCRENGVLVLSDGGIGTAGDICKAIGAGADIVMIGGMFASTLEADGELITKYYLSAERSGWGVLKYIPKIKTKQYKIYYGMSSHHAQNSNYGKILGYRGSEGRYCEIPYTGTLDNTLNVIEAGLRSSMTYVGARTIDEFYDKVEFYKVTHQLNTVFKDFEVGIRTV